MGNLKMSVTKRDLVIQVANQTGLLQHEVRRVVDCTLDTIIQALAGKEPLEIRNFGVFKVRVREARLGRNPRTGEEVPIPEKRIATFKPGKALKGKVDDGMLVPVPPSTGEGDRTETEPSPAALLVILTSVILSIAAGHACRSQRI